MTASTDATGPLHATGIVAVNSLDFVRAVFRCYAAGRLFVPLAREKPGVPAGLILDATIAPSRDSGWFDEAHPLIDDDRPAQVNFTSGTEGEPKGILLTHRNLADVIARLNTLMRVDASIREYVGVPAYHSFGLGRFRAVAAVGGRAYLPPHGFDATEIGRMLAADEINAISAVPTLWRTVLASPQVLGGHGGRVRWIEIGSQYMARAEKEALKALCPNARIVQHYGLTEASRSTLLDISAETGAALESVGTVQPPAEMRLDADGRIQLRGPQVARRRIGPDGPVPLTDAEGWLTTGDRGAIRDGRLFYEGRADDQINCGGVKLIPDIIEQRLRAALGPDCRLAVARVPDAMRGEGVLVAVEAAGAPRLDAVRAAARAVLADLGVAAAGALHVTTVAALPVTATGKVRRAALADQFVAGHDAEAAPALAEGAPRTPREKELVTAIEAAMGISPISIHASFFDLGGDSLSAINLIIRVEQLGVAKPDVRAFLDGRTIAEIAAGEASGATGAPERRPTLYLSDAINATRGLFVLNLIVIHWLPGLLGLIPGMPYAVNVWLNPFYRFGTPSFAMVFGIGVGFFFFHGLAQDRARVWRTIRFALMLLGGGILVMALFRFLGVALGGRTTGAPLVSEMFYSVLAFYFLAIASIPLWFALLHRWGNRVLAALWAALFCFALDGAIAMAMPEGSGVGPLDLVMLMLRSKYSYFGMTGIVMLGVAVGAHLRDVLARPEGRLETLPATLGSIGGLLLAAGLLLPMQLGIAGEWFTAGTDAAWTLLAYFGIVLVMLSLMIRFSRRPRAPGPAGTGFRLLTVIGLLSLVMFVGHEIVLPARAVLVALGLPGGLCLAALILLFIGTAIVLVARIYRFYHGGTAATARREAELA